MPTHNADLSRLSLSQLEALTGRTSRTIRKRLEGLEPIAQDGKTVWFSAREALPRIYQEGALDLSAERARLAKEQADAQELKNAQARRELVPAGETEELIIGLFSAVRARLLAVPTKAAQAAHAATSLSEAKAAIEAEITDALAELAAAEVRHRDSARASVAAEDC